MSASNALTHDRRARHPIVAGTGLILDCDATALVFTWPLLDARYHGDLLDQPALGQSAQTACLQQA